MWFFVAASISILYEGYSESFVLGEEKNPKWNISFILSLRSSIFHARCIYTLQDVQSDSYVFLCSSFMHTLFIWQSIYICNSTDAFDLKNIVKFSRNEKELGGRGGGVLESKEDKKYMTKSPS